MTNFFGLGEPVCCVLNNFVLLSFPELSADSCGEIKASEGTQAVSGNYWLDSTGTGKSILGHCNMTAERKYNQIISSIIIVSKEI